MRIILLIAALAGCYEPHHAADLSATIGDEDMALPDSRDLTFIDGVSQLPAATMNTIQDLLVLLYGPARMWVGPQNMGSAAGEWVYQSTNPGEWLATATNDELLISIPLFYWDTTQRQQLTSVRVRMKPGNTGVVAVQVYSADEMDTTNAPTATTLGSPGVSDGTANHQTVTATVDAGPADGKYIFVRVLAAQANDRVYGLRVDYEHLTD